VVTWDERKRRAKSRKEVAAAIARAPERVQDPECPYDPNDPGSVKGFWKGATVRRPGQRGPGKKAKKILLSLRYSPEVVEYFKSTGEVGRRAWTKR
jgi:hypothetical protein